MNISNYVVKKKWIVFLIISALILWQSSIVFAQLLDVPLNDELYREIYDFIDRMVARQAVTKVFASLTNDFVLWFKNTLPYSRAEVVQALTALDRKAKEGGLKLSKIEQCKLEQYLRILSTSGLKSRNTHLILSRGENHWFAADFGVGENIISRSKESTDSKIAYATLFRPTASGQIRDDFAFYSDLRVYYMGTVQFSDIPKIERRIQQVPKETSTGALTAYYVKFKLPWFEVFLGKDNLHWGPGRHGALLISEHPLPMNMFKLTAQYQPIKFQSVACILSSELDRKYLSGHRLELNLWKRLRMGVAETIIYGKRFEAIYLNPVQIYTTTEIPGKFVDGEYIEESPDNLLISGDLDIVITKNLEFYGEILIDDFRPFGYGLRSYRNWGSKFGILLGGYYIDPFSLPDTDFRIEYAFINQYTYNHKYPINTYTHYDSIIGHQIGTDADDLWLNLRHWFTANLTMSISYELERHGEGNVNKPHEGKKDARDDDEWEFLSGVTESTHSIIIGASYNLIGKYSFALEYTHFWIKNALNQDGVNDTNNQFLLSGQYRF